MNSPEEVPHDELSDDDILKDERTRVVRVLQLKVNDPEGNYPDSIVWGEAFGGWIYLG